MALAYPVQVARDAVQSLRLGRPRPQITQWVAWTHDVAARYAWLEQPAQHHLRAGVLLLAGLAGLLLALLLWRTAWWLLTRVGRLEASAVHGDARWLTRVEARRHLRYRPGGLVLGQRGRRGPFRRRGRLLALPPERQVMNTLLVGPPGSGKSTGVIIPTLLREREFGPGGRSLVVTDLKGELLRTCYDALAREHEVWVVNVLSPQTSLAYNPLAYCTDALSAGAFAEAWVTNTGASKSEPFWTNCAITLLQAGILHLQTLDEEPTLAHLYGFLGGQPPHAVMAALARSRSATARQLAHGFLAALAQNERALGSAFSEIAPRFRLMMDARVQATTSVNEVDFRRLGRAQGRPIVLVVTLDRRYQTELTPLLASFFLHLFGTLVEESDQAPDGRLARPVLVLADEFGNLGRIPGMEMWVSSLRSSNVALTLAVQTTAQLVALYGEEGAGVIRASCRTKLGLSGMGDQDARWFSEMAGQTTIVARSANASRRRFHALSESGGRQLAEGQGRLLTPDQVQRLPADELLACVGELPAVRLVQRRHYADRGLRGLWPARIPPLGPPRVVPLTPPIVPAWASPDDGDDSDDGTDHEDHDNHDDDDERPAPHDGTPAGGSTQTDAPGSDGPRLWLVPALDEPGGGR